MERLLKNEIMGGKMLSASQKYLSGECFQHFHDFYEIEYILEGEGISTINGNEEKCQPGWLCFLTPIDCHSVQSADAQVFNIMFSEQLVPFDLLAPFLGSSMPKTVIIPPEARNLTEQLCSEIVQNQQDTRYCALLTACLLKKLVQVFPKSRESTLGSVLSGILSYVISNYRKPITLRSAAAHVGLTPSYVSALFKKEMQVGFKEYLNSLRLEYAKKLLISTEESVRQICEESGFEDVPNFIKRFKACYGVTPTAVRKEWKRSR